MDDTQRALSALVRALRLPVPESELGALAPSVGAVYAAYERLRALPLNDREPLFRPSGGAGAEGGGAA